MQEGTTAARLQRKPRGSREAVQIQLHLGRRVALEGEELRQWQDSRKAKESKDLPDIVQEPITNANTDPSSTELPQEAQGRYLAEPDAFCFFPSQLQT